MITDSSRPTYYENEYLFDEMDSFSLNVFNWEKFFNTSKLRYKSLKYLEIGCFEGRPPKRIRIRKFKKCLLLFC